MAFAPDIHVFPGGAVDPSDADPRLIARSTRTPDEAAAALGGDLDPGAAIAAHIAAIRETFEESGVLLADAPGSTAAEVRSARAALVGGEIGFAALAERLDLTLRTDDLIALSHWVTPPIHPRRFDVRFFVAAWPGGAKPSLHGDEVAAYGWHRSADALAQMAAGDLDLWLPTSSTLQQLEHARSFDEISTRLGGGCLGEIAVDDVTRDLIRIVMPAGGGIAGQPVCAYLVGRRRFVLVDPGDPGDPALQRVIDLAADRRGSIAAIALTHVDPDHAAGAEDVAERLGIPILVGPGGGRPLPYAVTELRDGHVIDAGDVPLTVIATPGPRPDHVAFLVGADGPILSGDLDGTRGARTIPAPPDEPAWAASRTRVAAIHPRATRLGGHPSMD